MFANFTGWHALIILAVVVLLFGATKLPALAKGVGQSMRIFKKELRETEPASVDGVAASITDAGANSANKSKTSGSAKSKPE